MRPKPSLPTDETMHPIDGTGNINKDGCLISIIRNRVSGVVDNKGAKIYFH